MALEICRICGGDKTLKNIFDEGSEMIEKLSICANIQICKEDLLPKLICQQCDRNLELSYRLRKQSEATQKLLRCKLEKKQNEEQQGKDEYNTERENLNEKTNLPEKVPQLDENESTTDKENTNKEEQLVENKKTPDRETRVEEKCDKLQLVKNKQNADMENPENKKQLVENENNSVRETPIKEKSDDVTTEKEHNSIVENSKKEQPLIKHEPKNSDIENNEKQLVEDVPNSDKEPPRNEQQPVKIEPNNTDRKNPIEEKYDTVPKKEPQIGEGKDNTIKENSIVEKYEVIYKEEQQPYDEADVINQFQIIELPTPSDDIRDIIAEPNEMDAEQEQYPAEINVINQFQIIELPNESDGIHDTIAEPSEMYVEEQPYLGEDDAINQFQMNELPNASDGMQDIIIKPKAMDEEDQPPNASDGIQDIIAVPNEMDEEELQHSGEADAINQSQINELPNVSEGIQDIIVKPSAMNEEEQQLNASDGIQEIIVEPSAMNEEEQQPNLSDGIQDEGPSEMDVEEQLPNASDCLQDTIAEPSGMNNDDSSESYGFLTELPPTNTEQGDYFVIDEVKETPSTQQDNIDPITIEDDEDDDDVVEEINEVLENNTTNEVTIENEDFLLVEMNESFVEQNITDEIIIEDDDDDDEDMDQETLLSSQKDDDDHSSINIIISSDEEERSSNMSPNTSGSQNLLKKRTLNNNFQCYECNKVFLSRARLERHELIHKDIAATTCPECHREYRGMHNLKRHMRQTHKISTNEDHCSTNLVEGDDEDMCHNYDNNEALIASKTPTVDDNNSSINIIASSDEEEKSTQLPAKKTTSRNLKKQRDKKNLKCLLCNKIFGSIYDLHRHELIHKDTYYVQCPHCHVGYRGLHNLKRHMRKAHKINTSDDHCNTNLVNIDEGDDDNIRHNYGNNETLLAPKNTTVVDDNSSINLIGSSDEEEMPPQLPAKKTCTEKSPELPAMKTCTGKSRHLRAKNKKPTYQNLLKTLSDENNLKCLKCDKIFGSIYDFQRHEVIHKDVDITKCPRCLREYRGLDNLKRHMSKAHKITTYDDHCNTSLVNSVESADDNMHHNYDNNETLLASKKATVDDDNSSLNLIAPADEEEEETPPLASKKTCTIYTKRKLSNALHLKCFQCNKIFVSFANLERHKLTHKDATRMECTQCCREYRGLYNLEVHLQRVHSVPRNFHCDVCRFSFSSANNLKLHKLIHADQTFDCTICSESFKSIDDLVAHGNQHYKPSSSLFKCCYCSQIYRTFKSLQNHLTFHGNKGSYKCKICGKKFSTDTQMRMHLRSVHTNLTPYKCNLCFRCFKKRDILNRHKCKGKRKQRHWAACPVCDYKSPKEGDVEKHMQKCNKSNTFKCPICSQLFIRQYWLERHIKSVHPNEDIDNRTVCPSEPDNSIDITEDSDEVEVQNCIDTVDYEEFEETNANNEDDIMELIEDDGDINNRTVCPSGPDNNIDITEVSEIQNCIDNDVANEDIPETNDINEDDTLELIEDDELPSQPTLSYIRIEDSERIIIPQILTNNNSAVQINKPVSYYIDTSNSSKSVESDAIETTITKEEFHTTHQTFEVFESKDSIFNRIL